MHSMKTKFNHTLILAAVLAAGALGHPDTARGQNSGLSFSPNTINLSATAASSTPAQLQVFVTLNGNPVSQLAVSATDTSGNAVSWLTATTTITPSQSFFTVIANPFGLQPNTYNGQITVTAGGQQTKLPVTFTVFSNITLSADQTSLAFIAQVNGPAPNTQTVNVSSGSGSVPITVTAATTSGGSWLSAVANSTSTPAAVVVSINPANLAAGSYTGTVTVSSPQTQAAPATVNVSLTIAPQPVISATPNPVTMVYQSGSNAPSPTANVQLQSSSGTSQLGYAGTVTYPTAGNTCGSWLNVNNLVGTTPQTLSLTVLPNVLTGTQTCNATITITAPAAANATLTIPVTLTTNPLPLLNVYPLSLSFNYSIGGATPPGQALTVTNSGQTGLSFAVSTQTPWLSIPATPAGGFSPGTTVTVSLNQSQLPVLNPGTYSGAVTISALGAANSLTVPVTLTVSENPLLIISPIFANFNYQIGGTVPSPITLQIASTVGSLPYTLSVPTTTSTQFATFNPPSGTATTTPSTITISLNPSVLQGIQAGSYTNSIQVTAGGAGSGNAPQFIQATLNVTTTPQLNVSPEAIYFTQNGTTPPASQTLTITSTSGAPSVTVSPNVPWLSVSGAGPATPTTVTVGIVANNGLAPGNYSGTITVSSSIQTITIPVQITVTSGIALTGPSQGLTFAQTAGGSAPAAQTVMLNTTGGQSVSYSATAVTNSGGNWLSIANSTSGTFSGTAPGSFSVQVNGGSLQPGTYNGSIVVYSAGASTTQFTIPVTLTVSAAPNMAANPAQLTFTATNPFSNPPNQTVQITSTTSTPVTFTAAATSQGGNWLSVTSPAANVSATTPVSVTVAVSAAGLAAGTYNGTVTLTPSSGGGGPLTIPVTFTVGSTPTPTITAVQNAASQAQGAVSPGEIISLYGTNLGPTTAVGLTLTPAGNVSTSIGGVTVTFDGVPAPLTYVSSTQVNAVVPYEVAGRTTTAMVVQFNNVSSTTMSLNVAATNPGIFTANSSGSGQGAITNANYTLANTANPAPRGGAILIYATGEGQTNPAGVTGSVIGTNLKNPVAPVTVTIGGQSAQVLYAGSAPGDVSGVFQVNAVVPSNITPGSAVPVVVTVGSASSQSNVTIAVQ